MDMTDTKTDARHESKTKLLDAALSVIRARGYTATRIEDICEAAGLTKGSFFHHFKSKEELALAAAEHWNAVAGNLFAAAAYRTLPDPLDRLLGYVDFRKGILRGELPKFTCLLGTMVQEVYQTHPPIRDACDKGISEHATTIEADIAEAMRLYGHDGAAESAKGSAKSLALYIQAVIQGAFILAKGKGSPDVAVDCLDHLRRHLEMLFNRPAAQGKTWQARH